MDIDRLGDALARALVWLTIIEYVVTILVALAIGIPRERGTHHYPAARLLALSHGWRGLAVLMLALYAYGVQRVEPSGIAKAISTPLNSFVTWTVTLVLMLLAWRHVRGYNRAIRQGGKPPEGGADAPQP